jgi:hypothetical protein
VERTLASLTEIEPGDDGAGVYVVHSVGAMVKVGATRNMRKRMKSLNTGNPEKLRIVAFLTRDPRDELLFHVLFAATRKRREWFRADAALVAAILVARKRMSAP